MHLSIIKNVNQVIIDEVGLTVDCSRLSENFLALHWVDNQGWIELQHNGKPSVMDINDISEYDDLIKDWKKAQSENKPILEHTGMKKHISDEILDINLIKLTDEWEEFKSATNRF